LPELAGLSRRDLLKLAGASSVYAIGARSLAGCSVDEATSPLPEVYDYVVLGAGSAGCPLVARLLSEPGVTVLLVEAGGSNDREDVRDFTQSWKLTQPGSEVDWGYKSEPQPELLGKAEAYSAGKVLGGSSSINGMVWVRGHRGDFDGWAAQGCAGWGYGSVLPSFMCGRPDKSVGIGREPAGGGGHVEAALSGCAWPNRRES
jgi:choline dehydrogenase